MPVWGAAVSGSHVRWRAGEPPTGTACGWLW